MQLEGYTSLSRRAGEEFNIPFHLPILRLRYLRADYKVIDWGDLIPKFGLVSGLFLSKLSGLMLGYIGHKSLITISTDWETG